MAEIEYGYTMAPIQTILDGARQFGLTDDEIWETVNDCLSAADEDTTVPECIDELTGALARRILDKERHVRSEDPS
jgi:hypothetical protein